LRRQRAATSIVRVWTSLVASTSVVEALDGTGPSNELAAARVSRAKVLGMNGDHRGALAEFEAAARDAVDPELRRSVWLDAAFMLVGTDRAAEVIDDIVEVDATRDVQTRTIDVAALCLLNAAAGLHERLR